MKKLWFRAKHYGWGWYPATVAGWLVMLVYIFANVSVFMVVDKYSHSGSDTLIRFAPRFLILTACLYVICYLTGERPGWRWGPPSLGTDSARHARQRKISLEDLLREGKVAVIPTDTTYGIVGSAFNEKTVNEIYRLRKRDLDKPFIVLIADRSDLKKFGVTPTEAQEKILDRVWPASSAAASAGKPVRAPAFAQGYGRSKKDSVGEPVSVILPCPSGTFAFLHRGQKTLAFRLPQKASLRSLLRQTGPLVAPSANPQGHPVAKTIAEARAYFGHHVDFYEDGGTVAVLPSRLIDITDGNEKKLR